MCDYEEREEREGQCITDDRKRSVFDPCFIRGQQSPPVNKRALLLVLDSVGCGEAPDADRYGDAGADTLGHIYATVPGFALPHLEALGLAAILGRSITSTASRGRMRERSAGKDTTTGHWEIAGAPLEEPFATFEHFPPELLGPIEREFGVSFIGNYPKSGTVILEELGEEHLRTGNPIVYTSADSVLQIAAHESVFPLPRLYALCEIARQHCDDWRIGRVIARPFEGSPGSFRRSAGRHDYAMQPPRTVLNALQDAGHLTRGIGKISDIFAGSGIRESTPTSNNAEGMRVIHEQWADPRGGLIFANLVDFDMLYGHRRDAAGYARALMDFDAWLPSFLSSVRECDLVFITADHGNDPTFRGTDHTREEVPLLVLHRGSAINLGTRETFADIAATLAEYFDLPERFTGRSFLPI